MKSDAAVHMDRIYRTQRYFYDATRKFYLFGRDPMLRALQPPPGGSVLEIGCGTGRNLVQAARLYPQARFFGLDISARMLETARRSIARAGLGSRIAVRQADAADFTPRALFGENAFDRIFISYTLSMIPVWEEVLRQAACNLAPGGILHIVDFGQHERWPGWFRAMLRGWLARFSVAPRAELPAAAQAVAAAQGLACRVRPHMGGYALLVEIARPSGPR